MRIAYVGNFSQPHCTEVHIAATLEDLGHEVTRIQETPTRENANWHWQVNGHDLFLYTRTWGNMVTLDDLRTFKENGIPTASYHLDLYVGLKREGGLKDDPFWKTDFVFTPDGDPASRKVFDQYGINHYYMKPGVFKRECKMFPPEPDFVRDNDKLGNDVVFVGSGDYGHKEWPYRGQLLDWLKATYGDKYSKYGNPEKTVRNEELNQLYANSKIVVGDSLCLGFDKPYYWSDRVYETIGRGGFLIMPYIKGLEEEFTDGENIVFYKFGDFNRLKKQVDYYLSHDDEREKIRKNGFEFVKENSTYNNRLERMIEIVTAKDEWVDSEDGGKTNPELNANFNEFYESEMRKPFKISLGAGHQSNEEFFTVDLVDMPNIDLVHNLMDFPYPFKDNEADEIHAVDVIEHLDHYTDDKRPTIVAFIEECHRILKPGGLLYMQTPGWRAEFLWIDPTHVRPFDIKSFDFFDPDTEFGKSTGFYSTVKFKVKAEELPNHNLRFWLTKK